MIKSLFISFICAAAVIKFSNDTYTFPENIDIDAPVCIETTKVLSDDISIYFRTKSSDVNGAATGRWRSRIVHFACCILISWLVFSNT